jgi:spore germination protein YaaH
MIRITNGLLIAFAIFNAIFALSLKNQILLEIKQEECPIKYLVKPGDTLTAIASRFRTTVDDLIRENNINDPNSITAGNILRIPCKAETPSEIPAEELNTREENMTSMNTTENRNLTNVNITGSLGLISENMTIVINVLDGSADSDDRDESD